MSMVSSEGARCSGIWAFDEEPPILDAASFVVEVIVVEAWESSIDEGSTFDQA